MSPSVRLLGRWFGLPDKYVTFWTPLTVFVILISHSKLVKRYKSDLYHWLPTEKEQRGEYSLGTCCSVTIKPVGSHRSSMASNFLCERRPASRTGIWTSSALRHEKGYPSVSQGVAVVSFCSITASVGWDQAWKMQEKSQLQLPNGHEDSWVRSCTGVCSWAGQWNQSWFHFPCSLLQAAQIKGFSSCGFPYLTSRKTTEWMGFCSSSASKAPFFSSWSLKKMYFSLTKQSYTS